MKTVWELLIEHSSLSSGTAWEHLNNQVGGSGGETIFVTTPINVLVAESNNTTKQTPTPKYTSKIDDNLINVVVHNDVPINIIVKE